MKSFKFQISKAVQNIKTLLFIALLSLVNAQSKFNTNFYDNKKVDNSNDHFYGQLFAWKTFL